MELYQSLDLFFRNVKTTLATARGAAHLVVMVITLVVIVITLVVMVIAL